MRALITRTPILLVVLPLLLFGCGKKVGEFSLSVSAGGLFLDQNGSTSITVRATRAEGFTGNITLSLTGVPVGVEADFTPNPLAQDTSVLTLTAAGNTPVGTYTVKIVGSNGGVRSTIDLKLTIVLNTASSTGVAYVFEISSANEINQHNLDEITNQIIDIMKHRLNSYGIANAELKTTEAGQIEIQILGELDETQVLHIRRLLGSAGQIEFLKVVEIGSSPHAAVVPTSSTQEVLRDRNGIFYALESQPLLTSSSIANAAAVQLDEGLPAIRLAFTQDGAVLFSQLIKDLPLNECIAIAIDHVVYSIRCITQSLKAAAIEGWENVQSCTLISDGLTLDDANLLALIIRTGAFPVPVFRISETPFQK